MSVGSTTDGVSTGTHHPGSSPYGSRLLGPADQSDRAVRVRVQVLLTVLLTATNLVGAGLVFLIGNVIVPSPAANRATLLTMAIGVPVYVVVAVAVGVLLGSATGLHALQWTVQGRTPSERERHQAFRVPLRLTAIQFALWAGAAVLFTLLTASLQPERTVTTGLTIATAAVVVCGIAYLLAEFTLRPVAARALTETRTSDRPRGVGVRSRLVIFWAVGSAAPVLALMVGAVISLTTDTIDPSRLEVSTVVVGAVVLVFGLVVTVLGARAVESPLTSLREAMLDLERGELDTRVVVYDGTEIGLLQAGFNEMASGLEERERLHDLFGRHVGRDVAERAIGEIGDIELGGESREVTVLFVDLAGSTAFAVEHSPAEVVDVLNRFFGIIVREVDERGGLVNKFIGDAVLAVFGAPVGLDDHAAAALATARAIARRLADELPELEAGVGVATGEVVVGNVGHEERFEYTVIGDAVNSAARLTDLAKSEDGRVLAAWESVEAAEGDERGHWERRGETTLRGRPEPTRLGAPSSDAG